MSCENPAAKSIPPNIDVGIRYACSYTVAYNANGGSGEMKESVFSMAPSAAEALDIFRHII